MPSITKNKASVSMANKLAEVRNRYLYNIFHYFIERTKIIMCLS